MWLESLTPLQREAFIGLAYNVVVSDGLLDPNEERMLARFRREMALDPSGESDYLELDGITAVFDTTAVRRIVLLNLIHLSYADGALEVEEACLLRELADSFAVPASEFALLENWVRRLVALEREAQGFFL